MGIRDTNSGSCVEWVYRDLMLVYHAEWQESRVSHIIVISAVEREIKKKPASIYFLPAGLYQLILTPLPERYFHRSPCRL